MALTDTQKLELSQDLFCEKIRSYTDWTTFINMVNNITPTMLKTFLKSGITSRSNAEQALSDEIELNASKIADLADEY